MRARAREETLHPGTAAWTLNPGPWIPASRSRVLDGTGAVAEEERRMRRRGGGGGRGEEEEEKEEEGEEEEEEEHNIRTGGIWEGKGEGRREEGVATIGGGRTTQ